MGTTSPGALPKAKTMGEIARISKCYAVWSTTSPALLLDTALLVDAGDVIRDVVVVRSEDGVASFA